MKSILIADSGSTKTAWCLMETGAEPFHFQTTGINPLLQPVETITKMLDKEWPAEMKGKKISALHFYGSGVGMAAQQDELRQLFLSHFGVKSITVQDDLIGAAHALCGNEKGIVCILGTGSNSCYYDGERIADQLPSLGFIAGDEGAGSQMGKRILQYYAYHTFDAELRSAFELMFGDDIDTMISNLYRQPYPNRQLARMVPLLVANRGHYMVENIIEDCLNDFFHNHLLKYRESWQHPVHFVGSIAHLFSDVIVDLCKQYELELGTILQNPIEALAGYHSTKKEKPVAAH